MSYAPEIWIKITDDIKMILSCSDSCVGVGFWNLVTWKNERDQNSTHVINSNAVNMISTQESDLHTMIHICDDFALMSKVNISFATKNNVKINDIHIEIRDRINSKAYVLYPLAQPQTHSNSNIMPPVNIGNSYQNNSSNSNNRKRSFSNTMPHSSSCSPLSKKQKLN